MVFISYFSGRGVVGITFPGCPETPYRRFKEGDVIALPPGDAVWIYNDDGSNTPLEFVVAFTVGGQQANNQLETQHRVIIQKNMHVDIIFTLLLN
jgi:hypothetical protein